MLAYYAHNHGAGHCNYAFQFASHIPMLILTSRKEALQESMKVSVKIKNAEQNITLIPDEDLEENALPLSDFPTPSYLHYAPFGMKKSILRYQKVIENFMKYNVELLIVDVSVEMASFARIIGVPYIYVKMMGNRNDKPHLYAYEGAAFLIAFYPESLEAKETPKWVREKTLYMDFFSKFSETDFDKKECLEQIKRTNSKLKNDSLSEEDNYVTVLKGFGGDDLDENYFNSVRKLFPNHKILVVGKAGQIPQNKVDSNFIECGIVESTYPYIKISDFVVGACGSNTTSEIATIGKPFLMTPEERPFEEQFCMADGLQRMKVGLKIDFDSDEELNSKRINEINQKLNSLDSEWLGLIENNAVQIFAEWIKSKNLKDKNCFVEMLEEIKKYRSVSNLPL